MKKVKDHIFLIFFTPTALDFGYRSDTYPMSYTPIRGVSCRIRVRRGKMGSPFLFVRVFLYPPLMGIVLLPLGVVLSN